MAQFATRSALNLMAVTFFDPVALPATSLASGLPGHVLGPAGRWGDTEILGRALQA